MDMESSEDIAKTFEIIDRAEAMAETLNDTTNNNITTENQPDRTTNSENDDDNNNKVNNKKYSRDQLIQMKQIVAPSIPELKTEVKNLLFTESSELDNTLNRTCRNDATMPNFANIQNRSYQKPRSSEYQSGRRSQQGNRNQNLITVRLQSNEEIKLNEAKNAWKPQTLLSSKEGEQTEEERKTDELIKQFRSILNKLTPENFSTLIEKLKVLQIDTIEKLDTCISLVFEKAITEPNYASSYALLCKEVSDVFIVPLDPNNAQQKAVFKKRLISQCQREFEKHKDNELIKNTADRLKKIEEEDDPLKKEEMKSEFEFESTKVRKRAVGTVHFIGELYKIDMLTSKIMRSCITHLLDSTMCSEETLECTLKLLETVGKKLEKLDKNKVDLSEYFATLEKLADKKNPFGISSRIRFMIQDVVELRLNNWTPRRIHKGNKPLTMDEIKQQVILEQAIKDMDNKETIRDQDKGNRQNQRRTGAVNEEGWSTPYSKSRPVKFDPLKLPSNASDDIKLGQPSNFQNFSNFQNNRFAGLKEEDQFEQNNRNYNGRFSGGNPNLNNHTRNNTFDNRNNRNRGNRSAGSKSLQAPPFQGNQGKFASSRNTSNERQRHPSMQFLQRPNDLSVKHSNTLPRKISAPARPMQYSEAFMQERSLINDPEKIFKFLKSSVTDIQHKEVTMEEIVETLRKYKINKESLIRVFNWVFDHHDTERFNLTEIVCEAVCRNAIMIKDFLDALKEMIDYAQDLECDLPLVYNYIGQLLALPLMKRIINFKDLLEISTSQIEANNGANIFKNVLAVIEQQHGKDSLKQLYEETNVDFQIFFGKDQLLDDFLESVVRTLIFFNS